MTIRVLSSNIWGDYFGNPVDERQIQLGDVFARYSPDILGIQEATNSWNESALFASLAETYEFARGEGFPENNFVPLLWRRDVFDCAECGYVYFPDTPDASKGVTWAVLTHRGSGAQLCVLNTHFWYKKNIDEPEHDALRVSNAVRLTEKAKELAVKYGIPAVMFGDLNSRPPMPTLPYLREQGWMCARENAPVTSEVSTYHGYPVRGKDGRYHGARTADRFELSLDYILYRGAVRPLVFSVIEDGDALDATDHSPIFCDFEL